MIVIPGHTTVHFDVDETLLMRRKNGKKIPVIDPYNSIDSTSFWLVPHTRHIELLKSYKARGFKIVIWSANGVDWCVEAVRALQLEQYVDTCMSKPVKFVDDLPADKILGDHVYIPFEKS